MSAENQKPLKESGPGNEDGVPRRLKRGKGGCPGCWGNCTGRAAQGGRRGPGPNSPMPWNILATARPENFSSGRMDRKCRMSARTWAPKSCSCGANAVVLSIVGGGSFGHNPAAPAELLPPHRFPSFCSCPVGNGPPALNLLLSGRRQLGLVSPPQAQHSQAWE